VRDAGVGLPNDDPHVDLGAVVTSEGSILLYSNFVGSIGVYEAR